MGIRVECYTPAHRSGTCGCPRDPAPPEAQELAAAGWFTPRRSFEELPTLELLVDELVVCSMNLGAARAQCGITNLVDRVAKLRLEVIVRAGPQVTHSPLGRP